MPGLVLRVFWMEQQSAKFSGPQGVAVDSLGIVYVADRGNNRIRKVTTDGTVTTFAGSGVFGASMPPPGAPIPAVTRYLTVAPQALRDRRGMSKTGTLRLAYIGTRSRRLDAMAFLMELERSP